MRCLKNLFGGLSNLLSQSLRGLDPCQELLLVSTRTFEMTGLENMEVFFLADSVSFHDGDPRKLIVREYMNRDEPDCHARISRQAGTLRIQSGERLKPLLWGRVEIQLPTAYHGSLTVETVSGGITTQANYLLQSFRAASTSGGISFGELIAQQVEMTSVSGAIRLEQIRGDAKIKTVSGPIWVGNCSGSGHYRTTAGKIALFSSAELGNTSASTVSGDICLSLAQLPSFQLFALSTSGKIRTTYDRLRSHTSKSVRGAVGEDTEVRVTLTTTSGGIEIL